VALILLPNLAVSSIIGTLKIPAFSGTSFAANQYLKKVDMNWRLLIIMMLLAIPSAFLGSTVLTYVSNDFMKPLLLVVFIAFSCLHLCPEKFWAAYCKNTFCQNSNFLCCRHQLYSGLL